MSPSPSSASSPSSILVFLLIPTRPCLRGLTPSLGGLSSSTQVVYIKYSRIADEDDYDADAADGDDAKKEMCLNDENL